MLGEEDQSVAESKRKLKSIVKLSSINKSTQQQRRSKMTTSVNKEYQVGDAAAVPQQRPIKN